MAPICDGPVLFPKIFCSSISGKMCHSPPCDDAISLPVWRRGLFLQDAFFQYVYGVFEDTVRRILQRWGEMDFLSGQWSDPKLRLCDTLRHYRQLRTHNLKEEDQAVTVTTDGTTHKIVMDVHDFVNGEVKVKVSGEREVVVEGRTETKNGGWSVSCNSFRRRFCLPPHADLTAVSAVLSDDGILTVSAPSVTDIVPREMIIPIRQGGGDQHGEGWSPPMPLGAPLSPTGILPFFSAGELTRQSNSKTNVLKKKDGVPLFFSASTIDDVPVLPIPKMGQFFSDPFFKDTWEAFQDAVRDVLSRWGDVPAPDDALVQYRNLRSRDLREESQAVRWCEDDAGHRFVLDVQDFMNGEITVKFVNDKELVVEGRVEDQGSCSWSSRRFQRCFIVPDQVDLQAVTSVLSSDGVLTITAPKAQCPAVAARGAVLPVPVCEEKAEIMAPTHLPPIPPPRAATAPVPRVTSPTLSTDSLDSCDSDGKLWTFNTPESSSSVIIEEIE